MTSIKNVKGLKIVFWNAQSQVHKHHYITNMLSDNNIDVLVIVESWLRADIDNKFVKANDYTICRQDRAVLTNYNIPKRGGGICIYIKNTIPYTKVCDQFHTFNNDDLELITIRLDIKNVRPIYICAVYRPPTGNVTNFIHHITYLFDNLTLARKYDVYLGGDFNIDYAKPSRKISKIDLASPK